MKLYDNHLYSIHCAIIGDIIGFGNGNVEFNFNLDNTINNRSDVDKLTSMSTRHVADFISKGGYTNIDISNDNASDDTILLLSILDSLVRLKNQNSIDIIDDIKTNMNKFYKDDPKRDDRYYGIRTMKSLQRIDQGQDWDKYRYSDSAGGCGASMRSMPIGLIYYGENNRNKLMEISIQSSRITHNNPIGYLGGYSSALFTAFAIEKIKPEEWIFKLIENLKSDEIKKFIKNVVCKEFPDDYNKHMEGLKSFTILSQTYVDLKFDGKKYKDNSVDVFMKLFDRRSQFYFDNFGFQSKKNFNPGSNGFDSVIIAYDCLLDCKSSFETLIYYSMLHSGDSDSTGCIAGAFYGAYYGKFDLPKNYHNIEFYDKMKKLVDKIN
jgi:ADP-ribosylarginine hydrolase